MAEMAKVDAGLRATGDGRVVGSRQRRRFRTGAGHSVLAGPGRENTGVISTVALYVSSIPTLQKRQLTGHKHLLSMSHQFGAECMIMAGKGLLARQSLEDSALMGRRGCNGGLRQDRLVRRDLGEPVLDRSRELVCGRIELKNPGQMLQGGVLLPFEVDTRKAVDT